MHFERRVAALGLSLLAACESARPASRAPLAASDTSRDVPGDPALVAGGQTSEFSGGDVPYGYCPEVVSRTSLDRARADVAQSVALAEGQHEIPLRWQREFPDDRVRGFEERTTLLLDVQVIAAEDVVCESPPDETNYETSGYRARLRRLELAVEFSTADGAVSGSFQQPFITLISPTAEPLLVGGQDLPMAELEGTIELGIDPGLRTESQTLRLSLSFTEQAVYGSLTPWVMLPGPYRVDGSRPSWVPVQGLFPAPGEGCEEGAAVPLDQVVDVLGATPRAAYELARAKFPAQPIAAAWQDASQLPSSFTRTEVMLRPGAPTHACLNGQGVEVYASLGMESADGRMVTDAPVVAHVFLQPEVTGQARSVGGLYLHTLGRWTSRPEFEATAGIRDLDLGRAEYGALSLEQSFSVVDDDLRGELSVRTWENYSDGSVGPRLHWCAGPQCELYWCLLTTTDDGSSCSGR